MSSSGFSASSINAFSSVLGSCSEYFSNFRPKLPNYGSGLESLKLVAQWGQNKIDEQTKQNRQAVIVGMVACTALGIVTFIWSANSLIQAMLGLVAGAASVAFLATAAAIARSLNNQAIAAVKYREDAQGIPPPNCDTPEAKSAYLKTVYEETKEILKQNVYLAPNGKSTILLTNARKGVQSVGSSKNVEFASNNQGIGDKAKISIETKTDYLHIAQEHTLFLNLRPIVLFSGSDTRLEDKALQSSESVEADIYRRSALRLALSQDGKGSKSELYPLNRHGLGAYAPAVPVFRSSFNTNYKIMNYPFNTAFGMISSIFGMISSIKDGLEEKLQAFFHLAAQNRHQSVIVVIENNSPAAVEILSTVIEKFQPCFKKIVIIAHDESHKNALITNLVPLDGTITVDGGEVKED